MKYLLRNLVSGIGLVLLSATTASADEKMTAHYIDVGQADAALLEFPCGLIMIDAGTQDDDYVTELVDYLSKVFQRRSDLSKTIDLLVITHNHKDHTEGLREIVEAFKVKRVIETGYERGSGRKDPNWLRKNSAALGVEVRSIFSKVIRSEGGKDGHTNDFIDPVNCPTGDPKIRLLSGPWEDDPGWGHEAFDNRNNHSYVVRVDYGQSSFLFTGDLEEEAIEGLVDYYDGTNSLDVDVYQVGHHGSDNGTTPDLVVAMSPEIAVFSVGNWDFGRGLSNPFTTYRYGHPRKTVFDMLRLAIKRKRSTVKDVMIADRSRSFRQTKVRDAIYATSWDGTVRITTEGNGKYRVYVNR